MKQNINNLEVVKKGWGEPVRTTIFWTPDCRYCPAYAVTVKASEPYNLQNVMFLDQHARDILSEKLKEYEAIHIWEK